MPMKRSVLLTVVLLSLIVPAAMPAAAPATTDPDDYTEPAIRDIEEVDYNIVDDTTWDVTKTYRVTRSISVSAGKTLTIQAGTKVLVKGEGTAIAINGGLRVEGTDKYPVTITSGKEGSEIDPPKINDWKGIVITSKGQVSIHNCSISYAEKGIWFKNGDAVLDRVAIHRCSYGLYLDQQSDPDVTNCNISNNPLFGIYLRTNIRKDDEEYYHNKARIINTLLDSNGEGILLDRNATNTIINCTLTRNNNGISVKNWARPVIEGCTFSQNSQKGIIVYNASAKISHCQIDDNGAEGILISEPGETEVSYCNIRHNNDAAIHCIHVDDSTSIHNNTMILNMIGLHLQSFSTPGIVGNVMAYHHHFGIKIENTLPETVNLTLCDIYGNSWGGASSQSITKGEYCYWGDPSGPANEYFPEGGGDEVDNNIDFIPFLADPVFDIFERPVAQITSELITEERSLTRFESFNVSGEKSTAEGEKNISSYYFDFGDGSNTGWISDHDVTHNYTKKGKYTVQLMVRDEDEITSEENSTLLVTVLNTPPVLHTLAADVYEMEPGDSTPIRSTASDLDEDQLYFKFSCSSGVFDENNQMEILTLSNVTTWRAPSFVSGEYRINVSVYDGEDYSNTMEITINATARENNAPQINGFLADKVVVKPTETIQVSVNASDPDGDPLEYIFRCNQGAFAYEGKQSSSIMTVPSSVVLWVAPVVEETYTLTAQVSDKRNFSEPIVLYIEVFQNDPPEIIDVEQERVKQIAGNRVNITVQVNDPDRDVLTYFFSPSAGTIGGSQPSAFYQQSSPKAVWVLPSNVLTPTTLYLNVWVNDSYTDSVTHRVSLEVIPKSVDNQTTSSNTDDETTDEKDDSGFLINVLIPLIVIIALAVFAVANFLRKPEPVGMIEEEDFGRSTAELKQLLQKKKSGPSKSPSRSGGLTSGGLTDSGGGGLVDSGGGGGSGLLDQGGLKPLG